MSLVMLTFVNKKNRLPALCRQITQTIPHFIF